MIDIHGLMLWRTPSKTDKRRLYKTDGRPGRHRWLSGDIIGVLSGHAIVYSWTSSQKWLTSMDAMMDVGEDCETHLWTWSLKFI